MNNKFPLLIMLLLAINDTSCSSDEDISPVIYDGLKNWNECKVDRYLALVSNHWCQSATFNTNKLDKEAILKKIEFPFRMWDEDTPDPWDGSPGTFELNIIEGLPKDSAVPWSG